MYRVNRAEAHCYHSKDFDIVCESDGYDRYRFVVLVGGEQQDSVEGVHGSDLKMILDRLIFDNLLEVAA